MDGARHPHRQPKRQLDSTILHFVSTDCFYASVFENETPALRSLPLAVQQKQIVVTCNYEARRRGLHKLQLIKDAKKTCPDVVIVLGEDLTRFRNASKELFNLLRSFSWNSRCERLGFDEVFMDVSDIVEHNLGLLNAHDLANSYFCLSKNDPTVGFTFDASELAGHTYPQPPNKELDASQDSLSLRLRLASHLARYLREQLESEKGYTCAVGISTNKLLAKLVGNLHKPNDQTTLLPPYSSEEDLDNVTSFMDGHEVGKIPGIGFKIANKLRAHVLQRPAEFDTALVYGGTKEDLLVADARRHPGMGPDMLEQLLSGPGTPHGIGPKIWGLLNGCDDAEVGQAREVPKQISIEDSYLRLDTLGEVIRELRMLAKSLLARLHTDLLDNDEETPAPDDVVPGPTTVPRRWLAYPKTIRLSTRPRPPDGSRNRSFARISRSAPMPNFVFSLKENKDTVSERLVTETLVPLFHKLHPEKSGWNLSLMNVAATNMADAASEKGGVGRDIGKMFKRQDDVLKQWRVEDTDVMEVEEKMEEVKAVLPAIPNGDKGGSEDLPTLSQEAKHSVNDQWESEDEDMADGDLFCCDQCGASMPSFAMVAHSRWHAQS
ncbi:hypothetical protein BDV95DRAFT_531382 [Massariosphaeria phaeospora]|uniref:UmuC domain-containing protein n=1 Tax=Massariosphaeria phaeospora TaxID=100035 RepID=A0A7C8M4D5_9PLEO|nr:hypothetical protein BDV95DRAFT_531382 [Massariosphaeria phaeospora]